MIGQRQIDAPPSSSLDDLLNIARMLANPDALAEKLADLRAAIANAERATAEANEATDRAAGQMRDAVIKVEDARKASAQAVKDAADVAAQTQALTAAKRNFERHVDATNADMNEQRLALAKNAVEVKARGELAEARANNALSEANQRSVEAQTATAEAAKMMDSALALRADYEARLEKLRAIQS